ncbi:MAG: hypothetical protein ABJA67_03160, partial [Chthonomonadales bacterium]
MHSKLNRAAIFSFSASLLTLASFTASAQRPFANPNYITAAQLKTYLTFVASDEMEGRDTPSRGLDITAMFIAAHLERWGLKPGGDAGTYFQKIPLVMGRPKVLTDKVAASLSGKDLAYGDDFICAASNGEATGKLVYGGSGWYVKAKNMDPYAAVNVSGKIVVLNQGSTFSAPGMLRSEMTGVAGQDYIDPVSYAKSKGATGIIYVTSKSGLSSWARTKSSSEGSQGGYQMEGRRVAVIPSLPVIYASEKLCGQLFESEKT